jgi:hypothetical protein
MDDLIARFEELQTHLRGVWPAMTMQSVGGVERTVVAIHSFSLDIPEALAPVALAYEERFLVMVLGVLRGHRTRVVYVTSIPVLPSIVDYWFRLMPRLDRPEAHERLQMLSPVDASFRPLTEKILERPRFVERIRRGIADPDHAVIYPFNTSPLEVELAVRLGVPLYGSSPDLWALGAKSSARRIFAEEGVPCPAGREGIRDVDDLRAAIDELRVESPALREVIVKHDQGVSGLGNATIRLDGGRDVDAAIADLDLEDDTIDAAQFLDGLAEGAVVEERVRGAEFRSPSVQMQASPDGDLEVLSTHDQVLGGSHGMQFLGSRFPAEPAYVSEITRLSEKVGRRLAAEGVIGRFAVDFVVVRDEGGPWRAYAIEINLRCGGTTHTYMALQALTDGAYDPDRAELVAGGRPKYYVSSDHIEAPEYRTLTPEDFLEIVEERRIGWDGERLRGVVYHMVSAIAVAGRVGATAIADTPEEAEQLLFDARRVLDEETGRTSSRR